MAESTIEKAGTKPLDPDFGSIAAIKSKGELSKEIVRLHREGNDVLFNFDSGSDFKNASQIIAEVDQGGMGMPDRDYYFKDDPKSVELRKKSVEHVAKMFVLLGEQLPGILRGAMASIDQSGHLNPWWLAVYALAISVGLTLLRFVWVWTSLRLTLFRARHRGAQATRPNPRLVMAASLAGVRGAITLAGVMTLPLLMGDGTPFPARDRSAPIARRHPGRVADLVMDASASEAL
jgi:hypothetical protein